MNQFLTEKTRKIEIFNNQNNQEFIEKITDLSVTLQKQNLTNHPPLVAMNLIKWLKNIPVKSSEIIKLTGDICQYTLQKIQEKLKDAQENNQIENTKIEEIVNEFTIDFLVEQKWFISGLNSREDKEEVSILIKENLSELRNKTDNVYLLIFTILENTKSSSLVELLVEYITEERKNKIFLKAQKYVGETESKLSDDDKKEMQEEVEENINKFWADVKGYLLIDNWQTKLTEDYQQDESLTPLQIEYLDSLKSINDKFNNEFKNNFWWLVTYVRILEKKEIPFNSQSEEQVLKSLGLIVEHNLSKNNSDKPRNKYQVVNKIYKQIFSLNWTKNQIIQAQENDNSYYLEKVQAIFNFTISDRFTETVNIIKHKFPNHIKTIIENTIFWTGRNSFGDNDDRFDWTKEEQSLTEKIFQFIEKYFFAEALFPIDKQPQDWFTENIMYSLSWKDMGDDKITLKEFEELISTRIILLEEKIYDKVHLIKGLLKLASPDESQFKNNPLYVADKTLRYIANVNYENEKIKRLTILVNYITENHYIIKDEEYFRNHPIDDQFYQEALEFKNSKETSGNVPPKPTPNIDKKNREVLSIMPLNEKLKEIVDQNQQIAGIFLVNLQYITVDYYNPQLTDLSFFDKLKYIGSTGEALELFSELEPTSKTLNKFGQQTNSGQFKFALYWLEQRSIIISFTEIYEVPFAICYLAKEDPALGVFLTQVQKNIPIIEQGLQEEL
ncbi:hypothetical protein [Geminocystis sp. GBBB08]|uniref:hypothetical protein n=1 Tax=Geminocystis sp. GBBB08 TaxID=2604140 RepID=UPI0027E39C87|nr:hypothetical protein [Geminocystis sp. GBBB08]MBL1211062.1 hypothetical protein [Geminocystis sp. GBBB08]